MAKNYVQPGDILDLPAPSGGVVSGTVYLIGSMVGVAVNTVAQTLPAQFKTTGVFLLPKATGTAWTGGDRVYWDNSAMNFTKTSTSNTLAGIAAAAAASGDATGLVRLNGSF